MGTLRVAQLRGDGKLKAGGGERSFNRCGFPRTLEEKEPHFRKHLPDRFHIDDEAF
jgi:hypothetical protein